MTNFEGIYTALITPFHQDGALDLQGLLFNVQEQLNAGIHGLVLFGSTGESIVLDEDEIALISENVIRLVNGRIPVVIGTTHSNTKVALQKAKAAELAGASALLIAPPPYNKPNQEGLYRHYSTIKEAVSIPIILYDNPGRTGLSLSLELQKQLSCSAMKDSTGKIDPFLNPVQPILAGDDSFLLPAMSLGCRCLVSVLSNLFPEKFVKIFSLCQENDFHSAYSLFQDLIPFVEALALETNPIVVKKLMQLYDKPSGPPRLPLTEASPATLKVLKNHAEKYQLCPA